MQANLTLKSCFGSGIDARIRNYKDASAIRTNAMMNWCCEHKWTMIDGLPGISFWIPFLTTSLDRAM